MLYYQVKPEYDNSRVWEITKKTECKEYLKPYILIGFELLTEKEFLKLKIPASHVETVNYKKCNSYYFFGCRYNTEQLYTSMYEYEKAQALKTYKQYRTGTR